jgi:membrane protease YdiL (CAAX protease family)
VLIALYIATKGWYTAIARLSPQAGRWLHSPAGTTCRDLLQEILFFLAALWFARRGSVRNFLEGTGLTARPTLVGWVAACGSIGLSFVVAYGHYKNYIPTTSQLAALRHGGQAAWFAFIILTVCTGPFCEEVTMRGFLYRAFRTTYGQVVSTVIVFCVDGYFHWNIISQSLYFFACHTVFQVAMYQLRERTKSVWNCILPHAVYNATISLSWPVYVVGLILLFPYCTCTVGDRLPANAN